MTAKQVAFAQPVRNSMHAMSNQPQLLWLAHEHMYFFPFQMRRKVEGKKPWLVIVNHLTAGPEAFPTTQVRVAVVVKFILQGILPHFGLPESIDRDLPFVAQIMDQVYKCF